MARVFLDEESIGKQLSGTVGRYQYRTIDGKVFANLSPKVVRKGTRQEQRLANRRYNRIVGAVGVIQREMDVFSAAEKHKQIYNRMAYLYDKKLSSAERKKNKKELIALLVALYKGLGPI